MSSVERLTYPSKKYIGLVKTAVNRSNAFEVEITTPKHQALVEAELDFLLGGEIKEASLAFLVRWWKLLKFLTGHFYAIAAGYSVSRKMAEGLSLIYEPANQGGSSAF